MGNSEKRRGRHPRTEESQRRPRRPARSRWENEAYGESGEDGIMGVALMPVVGVQNVTSLEPGTGHADQGPVMERLRELLEKVRKEGVAAGNFLGLLHVVIGRRIQTSVGEDVSNGVSWRDLAALLKKLRWSPEAVAELGVNAASLPPRDRQRYWYQAIAQARVDSAAAVEAGDRLAQAVAAAGYVIGPAPRT